MNNSSQANEVSNSKTAYVVKAGDGGLCIWQMAISEDDAINKFLDRRNGAGRQFTWSHFVNEGYSSVKVSIQEAYDDR